MKRLLFCAILLLPMAVCGVSLAAGPKAGQNYTFQGNLGEYDGLIMVNDTNLGRMVVVASATDGADELSPSLFDCVVDFNTGGYKGRVEVTGKVWIPDWNKNELRVESREAICKRLK